MQFDALGACVACMRYCPHRGAVAAELNHAFGSTGDQMHLHLMPTAWATPPPMGRPSVPSSEPALDEVGGIGDAVPAASDSPTAVSASARIMAEARERARAAMDATPELSDMLGLDDDSDDEALRVPRRPRRAASQRGTYRDKLSLTRPADERAQRQHGVPKPLTLAQSKYSLEALSRDKARRERRGLLSQQYADVDALIAQIDAPTDRTDPHAALWTTLDAPEAEHLVHLVKLDQVGRTSHTPLLSSFWRTDPPPVIEVDPSEAAVLSCLRWQPWLSSDLVAPMMRLCLARDECLARRARAALVVRSDCVGRLVVPLLAAMGADTDVLARAAGAAVAPLAAWNMPSPRLQAMMRLWQLLASCSLYVRVTNAVMPISRFLCSPFSYTWV